MAEMFPAATLLGSLLGLGALANQSELVVIRAAGVSLLRIVGSVMRAGLLLVAVSVLLGEVLAPASQQFADSMRAAAKSGQITLRTDYGFWAKDGRKFINVEKVLSDGRLQNVLVYEFDRLHRLRSSTYVHTAAYQEGSWLLDGVVQSFPTESGVRSARVREARWPDLLDPSLLQLLGLRPDNLNAWGLYRYIHFLHSHSLDAHPYQVALWGRLMAPVATLTMLLLAIPFVLGPLRGVGVGQRILVGALIGIGFSLLNHTFANVGLVYELNAALTAAFPAAVALSLALWGLSRMR
jgi:lipopolysaccharide export system permease protein